MNLAEEFLDLVKDEEMCSGNGVHIFQETCVWMYRNYLKTHYKDYRPLPYIFFMRKGESNAFYADKVFYSIAREIRRKVWNNPSVLDELREQIVRDLADVDKKYDLLTYVRIAEMSLDELKEKLLDLQKIIEPKLLFAVDKEFCEKNIPFSVEDIWDKASNPVCESFARRQHALVIKAKGNDLAEKFQYLGTSLTTLPSLDESEKKLKEYDTSLELLEKFETQRREREEAHKEWVTTLNEEEKLFVKYIQTLIEVRDIRKDVHCKGITLMYRIAQRLCKEAGLHESVIDYVAFSEFVEGVEYLRRRKEDIMKRKEGYVMLIKDDGTIEESYDYDVIETLEEKPESEEIKGQAASKGKVTGVVTVVTNPSKDKFVEGTILVTGMTRAEYVPLMEKSIGIITDEGGVTCHAAIMARELGKPCIIGTQHATKVLKSGDKVELDADNGVVRKI